MTKIVTAILERLQVYPQYLIPQHFLTHIVYRISRSEIAWLKNILIKQFIKLFNVDMTLAKQPDATSYSSFNTFFTRELSAKARPIALDTQGILSPVDGTISQIGDIQGDSIIQAKNKSYNLQQLLLKEELVNAFYGGTFATLYLSPKDYHRIHMPLTAHLQRMIYVPGRLFGVGTATVHVVDNVFAKNERLISIFNSEIGSIAIIMVGALNVGSMETVWSGAVTPTKNRHINDINYLKPEQLETEQTITLQQGQEMGRFNMGSTVILLFPKDTICWAPHIGTDKTIIMGENIATHAN